MELKMGLKKTSDRGLDRDFDAASSTTTLVTGNTLQN